MAKDYTLSLKTVERMNPSRGRAEELVKILEKNLFHLEAGLLKIALRSVDDTEMNLIIYNYPRWEKQRGLDR